MSAQILHPTSLKLRWEGKFKSWVFTAELDEASEPMRKKTEKLLKLLK